MPDARDPMELAAREIAKTNIPAYADDKIWAEDWPMYLSRDLSGVDNPIATARATVLAFLEAVKGDPSLAHFHGVQDQVIDVLKAKASGT